jgi:outer membrane scaffolding protein for murein synthesis (MipA/OmpV family)
MLVGGLVCPPASAENLPLWEAGLGVGVVDFPDYRGSDQRSTYALPIPYFVYRGEKLRIDRNSLRGLLFESERVELDLSLNGSIPVDSDDNDARDGMPDLDPTLEVGPILRVHLLHPAHERYRLDLRMPLRAVITTGFDHVGWTLQPQLNLDLANPLEKPGWKLGLVAGPVFADGQYHDYFYGVASRFATVGRPAYDADGGYGGSQVIAALSKRYPKFWVGGFLKWDSLKGAVFEESPLVRDTEFLTAGFALSWVFWESKERVEAAPDPD